MTDITTVARNCMTGLIKTKKARCAEAAGPVDLVPMLHIRFEHEEVLGLVDNGEEVPLVVAAARAEIDDELVWVAFLADMLIREIPVEIRGLDLGQHSNRERRDAGDMTVKDGLSVFIVDAKTDEVTGANLTYTYDDAGQPRFGPVWFPDELVQGVIIDALRAAVS